METRPGNVGDAVQHAEGPPRATPKSPREKILPLDPWHPLPPRPSACPADFGLANPQLCEKFLKINPLMHASFSVDGAAALAREATLGPDGAVVRAKQKKDSVLGMAPSITQQWAGAAGGLSPW